MMSDIADKAGAVIAADMARGVAAVLHQQHTAQLIVHGVVVCRDCGDAIVQARLDACPHAARCVPCQYDYEMAG